MGMEKFSMYAQLYETQQRFQRASDQLVLLNNALTSLNRRCRYDIAGDQDTVLPSMRIRIEVLEGIMAAYCKYICLKKNEISDLRFKLYGEDPEDGEEIYDDFSADEDNDETEV